MKNNMPGQKEGQSKKHCAIMYISSCLKCFQLAYVKFTLTVSLTQVCRTHPEKCSQFVFFLIAPLVTLNQINVKQLVIIILQSS